MRRRLAVLLAVLSAVCVVADTVVAAAHESLLSEAEVAAATAAPAPRCGPGMRGHGGVDPVARRLAAVGWLLSVVGVAASVSLLTESYAKWVLSGDGPGPRTPAHYSAWLSVLLGAPIAVTCVTLMFLTAPDGRLRSRRWRPVAWLSVAGVVSYCAAVCTVPPSNFAVDDVRDVGWVTNVLATGGVLAVGVALLAAAVAATSGCGRAGPGPAAAAVGGRLRRPAGGHVRVAAGRPGLQRRTAGLRRQPPDLHRLPPLPPADGRGGPPLPAVRHRGPDQPRGWSSAVERC